MSRLPSPFALGAIVAVVALLALLAYGQAQSSPDRGIERALVRGERAQARDFTLDRLGGTGRGSLADYRGRVVVLNFWASWCDPCRAESPLLERWHERLSKTGATVLGVDSNDVTSDALEFVREYGLTYPMLKDRGDEVAAGYGAFSYPETFVIDRRGRIAASRRGPVNEAFMRDEVLPLAEAGS